MRILFLRIITILISFSLLSVSCEKEKEISPEEKEKIEVLQLNSTDFGTNNLPGSIVVTSNPGAPNKDEKIVTGLELRTDNSSSKRFSLQFARREIEYGGWECNNNGYLSKDKLVYQSGANISNIQVAVNPTVQFISCFLCPTEGYQYYQQLYGNLLTSGSLVIEAPEPIFSFETRTKIFNVKRIEVTLDGPVKFTTYGNIHIGGWANSREEAEKYLTLESILSNAMLVDKTEKWALIPNCSSMKHYRGEEVKKFYVNTL